MFSENNCQHVSEIDEMLPLLHSAGVTLKVSKWQFFRRNLNISAILMPSCLVALSNNVSATKTIVIQTDSTKNDSFWLFSMCTEDSPKKSLE